MRFSHWTSRLLRRDRGDNGAGSSLVITEDGDNETGIESRESGESTVNESGERERDLRSREGGVENLLGMGSEGNPGARYGSN